MDCSLIVRDELAERYLLGDLSPAEQEAYEQHYFECARCFGELRRLQAIRDVLRAAPPAIPAPKGSRVWNPWWGWAMAGAVAAALVAVVLLRQSGAPEPVAGLPRAAAPAGPTSSPGADPAGVPAAAGNAEPSVALAPPAAAASPEARRLGVLARLARAEPPRYSPRVLRGAADEATVSFQQGMKGYVAGDYGAAIRSLRQAGQLDPERPDIAFFLAASELLAGNIAGAVGEFERTIAMGDTPFLEEAHFYLAKALLKRGDVRGARRELTAVADIQGELRHDADAILRQLENLDTSH